MNGRDPLGMDYLFDKLEVELGHEDGRSWRLTIPLWAIVLPVCGVLTYVVLQVVA